jgi:uncharacterized protein YjdB
MMLTIHQVHSRALLVGVLVGVLVSCGKSAGDPAPTAPTPTPTPTPVLTSISLSGGTGVIVGASVTLTASPKDQNGNAIAATITWSSSAPSVAAVSGSGVVTGVAAGTTTITATSGSVVGTASVTVAPLPPVLTTITISGGASVGAGSTLQLTAVPKDQNGSSIAATLTWSSSAPGIATVNSSGLVTGVAAGAATISATSGTVVGTTSVTVTAAPAALTTITISGGTSVVAGATLQLSALPKDQYGAAFATAITWASSALDVATVSSGGVVTGVDAGTTTITARSGTVVGLLTVTVTAAPPVLTTITVAGGASVNAGSTLQLTASPRDQYGNAIAASIVWTSSAPSFATVSSSGLVTGVAAGTATITAASGGVAGSVFVTVNAVVSYPSLATVDATVFATFSPATIDIARLGTVNFAFAATTHNVTFGTAGAPANIPNTAGATVARTFNLAGSFTYQCTIHAGMTGTVIVH